MSADAAEPSGAVEIAKKTLVRCAEAGVCTGASDRSRIRPKRRGFPRGSSRPRADEANASAPVGYSRDANQPTPRCVKNKGWCGRLVFGNSLRRVPPNLAAAATRWIPSNRRRLARRRRSVSRRADSQSSSPPNSRTPAHPCSLVPSHATIRPQRSSTTSTRAS